MGLWLVVYYYVVCNLSFDVCWLFYIVLLCLGVVAYLLCSCSFVFVITCLICGYWIAFFVISLLLCSLFCALLLVDSLDLLLMLIFDCYFDRLG